MFHPHNPRARELNRDRESWVYCDTCEKRRYHHKKAARKVARTLPPTPNRERKPSVYRCPELPGWHIGHIKRAVKQGLITRHEAYNNPEGNPPCDRPGQRKSSSAPSASSSAEASPSSP